MIPRGEIEEGEEPLAAAKREFNEETGFESTGPYISLGEARQKSGKQISVWAFRGDCDLTRLRSNTFEIEWPPRSGKRQKFPEVDRVAFFSVEDATKKIMAAELVFLEKLGGLDIEYKT